MPDGAIEWVTLATAIGCATVGGVFFAFPSFVMGALAKLPSAQGAAAMQLINVVVINPWFMAPFLGTAAACAGLGAWSIYAWDRPGAALALAGSVLYVVGSFGVTVAFNVPRNEALAAVDPASADGAALWAQYLRGWTAWNHVRTAASLLAAAAFIAALIASARGAVSPA